jgi:hypothetical protein
MTSPLDWTIPVTEIGEAGRGEERSANSAEREAVAKTLAILSCDQLTASYEVKPMGSGRYRLTGDVEGDVTQSCIVTLDPVTSHISDAFAVELWPPDQMPASGEDEEREILAGDDVEAIENGRIPVGRIVFEHISAVLDPYPRKPGAEFDWRDPKAEADAKAGGAFAALAKLKQPK